MNTVLKSLLNIILFAGVCFLSYQLYLTILEPIVFNESKLERDEACQANLKKIRALQLAFKSDNQRYSNSWEELETFAKQGEYKLLKKIGDPNDTTIVARVDTLRMSVMDSLFTNRNELDSLRYIPFGNGNKFLIEAGNVVKNELEIPAFEVSAPYNTLYDGLIKKYWQNKVGKLMTIGSMEDGSTSGNWGE